MKSSIHQLILISVILLGSVAPTWGGKPYKIYVINRYGAWDIVCDSYTVQKDDHVWDILRRKGSIAEEDYARLLSKYFPQCTPTFVGFEGFVNAKILVEVLRRAGRELTREGFIDAVETLERYFVGIGAKVSFGSNDHQGLGQVYFTKIEDGKVTMFTDWKNFKR
jgi:hypothetical protein